MYGVLFTCEYWYIADILSISPQSSGADSFHIKLVDQKPILSYVYNLLQTDP